MLTSIGTVNVHLMKENNYMKTEFEMFYEI